MMGMVKKVLWKFMPVLFFIWNHSLQARVNVFAAEADQSVSQRLAIIASTAREYKERTMHIIDSIHKKRSRLDKRFFWRRQKLKSLFVHGIFASKTENNTAIYDYELSYKNRIQEHYSAWEKEAGKALDLLGEIRCMQSTSLDHPMRLAVVSQELKIFLEDLPPFVAEEYKDFMVLIAKIAWLDRAGMDGLFTDFDPSSAPFCPYGGNGGIISLQNRLAEKLRSLLQKPSLTAHGEELS